MAVNFDKLYNYDRDISPFQSIRFGSGGTVLEVELNEMQDIIINNMRTFISSVIGNIISDPSQITYDNTAHTLHFNNCIICANGYIVRCNNISLSANINDNIYISILEEDVTKDSVLKKYGYVNGTQINNTIKDSRVSDETSRRRSIKYTLGTSQISGYSNILLGTISASGFNMNISSKSDMSKSVYDTNNNGIVDNAEKFGGKLPSAYVLAIDGKGLSTYDFTSVYKTKLDNIAEGATKTIIDTDLSSISTNPIQNKAITTALNEKGKIFTTSVGTVWTEDGTGFKQQIDIAGMKVTYNPTVSLNINNISLDVDSMREDMAKIYRIETYDGYIIVKAKEKTVVELPLVLKV